MCTGARLGQCSRLREIKVDIKDVVASLTVRALSCTVPWEHVLCR